MANMRQLMQGVIQTPRPFRHQIANCAPDLSICRLAFCDRSAPEHGLRIDALRQVADELVGVGLQVRQMSSTTHRNGHIVDSKQIANSIDAHAGVADID